jgi:hypothetical protein
MHRGGNNERQGQEDLDESMQSPSIHTLLHDEKLPSNATAAEHAGAQATNMGFSGFQMIGSATAATMI